VQVLERIAGDLEQVRWLLAAAVLLLIVLDVLKALS
jgi:hypothetical protein